MTGVTIAFAVLFGVAAGILGIYALRSGKGEVPFGAPSPLIGQKLRENRTVWETTHRRSVPYLWTAAVVCFIQMVSLWVMFAYPSLMTAGYLAAVVITGVILVLLLLFLGGRQSRLS